MLRKYLARLLAFALVLNLVLCAPLSVGAEEVKFEAAQNNVQSVVVAGENTEGATTLNALQECDTLTKSETGNVVVSDTAETTATTATEGFDDNETIPDQAVSVEVPEPAGDITNEQTVNQVTDNGVTVDESFDLDADITEVKKEGNQITDIEYDISLDAQGTVTSEPTDSVEPTVIYDIDRNWQEVSETQPEFKVNMSINGMNDQEVTRVEHKYKETEDGGVKVEYYYNAKTKTDADADSGKKFFTVVQKTVEDVTSSFVSLVTNFLGKFHITTDAFENQTTKEMSTTLDEAVNSAASGSTVEMLRDASKNSYEVITDADNVTVDMNDYDLSINGSIYVQNSNNQTLTIKNGTIKTPGTAFVTTSSGNEITLNNVTLKTGQNQTSDGFYMGIWDAAAKNKYTIENSTIDANHSYWAIYHNGSTGGAYISVIGSYISADGEEGAGIYIAGSTTTANNPDQGLNVLELKNSTVKGDTGVEVKFTDVTIDNSTLVGFGTPAEYIENNNGSTTVGAALAVTDNANGITGGKVVINSGYFKGSKDIDNIYLAVKDGVDQHADIQLNGGRFVNVKGLYKLTDDTHAVISHNDGSEYPYEVVKTGTTPTRAGYKFLGYKDDQGNAITLEQAIAKKAIAYAQWELIPAEADETPVKPATAPAEKPVIIVEPDSKGNNVDVTIKGGTAEVTVSTPAGEAAAVSEVTIPSVAALQEQGVKTVKVQVEENVTLELGVAKNDDTAADTIKITREDDILVITSGEQSEIAIHMTALKAAAAKPVSIKLDNGVLTIDLGNGAYKLNVADALAASKSLSVKLEDGVLKLYDKDGNLIQEIKI